MTAKRILVAIVITLLFEASSMSLGAETNSRKSLFVKYQKHEVGDFYPGGLVSTAGGADVLRDRGYPGPGIVVSGPNGPAQMWPVIVPVAVSSVPTKRDELIQAELFRTFGYPVSKTQFQEIELYRQEMSEQLLKSVVDHVEQFCQPVFERFGFKSTGSVSTGNAESSSSSLPH